MRNLPYKPLAIRSQQVAIICPACDMEIGLEEIIERKGYVGCINCTK